VKALIGFLVSACCVLAAGCTSDRNRSDAIQQTPPEAGQPAAQSSGGLVVEFTSSPDPLTAGRNEIAVSVRHPDGMPVEDAAVSATFSMPAMPSMNMPAMRSTADLTHESGGRYRGVGELSMNGTWNVTVTVSRGTEELARRTFSIVAR
jgi:hypothetical protein